MSPEFRHSFGDAGSEPAGEEERRSADFTRFRFTNAGRRKLRGKKKAAPSGLHKRHNKRLSW